jgi:hypothetical protein
MVKVQKRLVTLVTILDTIHSELKLVNASICVTFLI